MTEASPSAAKLMTFVLAAALSGCAGRMAHPVAAAPLGAVARAEVVATASPASADERLALARAYLSAGRFASADAAFRDTLTLAPDNRRAIVGLALMEIAAGRVEAARPLLDRLPADDVDASLARALTGDPMGAASQLDRAARLPGADGRTRQNLALVLAMAGRWVEARMVASEDLSPDAVDRRLGEWALMTGAADPARRVAALLGVMVMTDPGQPVAVALRGLSPTAAERPLLAEVTLPSAPLGFSVTTATSTVTDTPRPPYRPIGRYVVQLGAFADSAGARDAWRVWAGTMPGRMPLAGVATGGGQALVRLSIGGLDDLSDARALCRRVQAGGGRCYVRPRADDRPAEWLAA